MTEQPELRVLRELAEKWRKEALNSCYMSASDPPDGWRNCADELLAAIPKVETEIDALKERTRLEVAAALENLSRHHFPLMEPEDEGGVCSCGRHFTSEKAWKDHILALIPPADRTLLDAHDREVRDLALEEAITPELMKQFLYGYFTSYNDDWVNVAKHFQSVMKEKGSI